MPPVVSPPGWGWRQLSGSSRLEFPKVEEQQYSPRCGWVIVLRLHTRSAGGRVFQTVWTDSHFRILARTMNLAFAEQNTKPFGQKWAFAGRLSGLPELKRVSDISRWISFSHRAPCPARAFLEALLRRRWQQVLGVGRLAGRPNPKAYGCADPTAP